MNTDSQSVSVASQLLCIVDPDAQVNGRREQMRRNARAAGFEVRCADSCEEIGRDILAGASCVLGHNYPQLLNFHELRTIGARLRVIHYSGGTVQKPLAANLDREFAVEYPIARGQESQVPSIEDFRGLFNWLVINAPRPRWVKPFEASTRNGIQALDILCVGLLAVANNEAFSTDPSFELQSLPDRAATILTDPSEWFRVAVERLRNEIAGSDGKFWTDVGENDSDPSIRQAAITIRGFYEKLESSDANNSVGGSGWLQAAKGTHEAFKVLWSRRYL